MQRIATLMALAGGLVVGLSQGASAQSFGGASAIGRGAAPLETVQYYREESPGPRGDRGFGRDDRGPRRDDGFRRGGVVEERIIRRDAPRRTVCRTVVRERVTPSGVVIRRPTEVCRTVGRGF